MQNTKRIRISLDKCITIESKIVTHMYQKPADGKNTDFQNQFSIYYKTISVL